ncbi:MAG: DUF2391 family protein [Candidatus Thermoplasmatota archaeon]|nr:DUF2391 family protein [Candidatus Thermoplasmatota archaeon]
MFKKEKPRIRVFSLADLAQQLVGGFLLSGPFVVTEEVWALANNLHWYQSLLATLIVFSIGYGALYEADVDREQKDEAEWMGIPLRFLSLIFVSYASVTLLILIFGATVTFGATLFTAVKVVSIVSLFSVIGAATADSLF